MFGYIKKVAIFASVFEESFSTKHTEGWVSG